MPIRTQNDLPAKEILERMKEEHNIMLAGSFDSLSGQVIRIGHMGSNANKADMEETMEALDETLRALGVELKSDLGEVFAVELNKR